jgi:hypothetical protein
LLRSSSIVGLRRLFIVACMLGAIAVATASSASANVAPPTAPVPSLQPKLTQQLWERLVHRQHTLAVSPSCRPLRAYFYTESDWLRLATKLAVLHLDSTACG